MQNTDVPSTAELEVGLFTSEPLLSEEEFQASRVLNLQVFSAYSLPEKWVDFNTFQYTLSVKGKTP